MTYVVDEGARVYIERIDIRGNTRTRDYVIRREFDIAEGDAFNRVLIDRAQRRLRLLGYFSDVNITTEPGSADDRVVVVVTVVEQPTGSISFGVGYSTSDGAVGDISLTEKNFLGRGYNLRVAVGAGIEHAKLRGRVHRSLFPRSPHFGRRKRLPPHLQCEQLPLLRLRDDRRLAPVRVPDHRGFHGSDRLPDRGREDHRCSYQCDGVGGDDVSLAICQSRGDTLVSSVLYSLIYDTLDNRRDPHDGFYVKFTQEFAGVGGDVRYLKTTGSGSYYHELLPDRDVVGLIKVQGGDIFGIGENVRLLDSFFKGGETVRGFQSSGFGPRDPTTGDALGGKIFVAGTAEMQFPLPLLPKELGLKGAVFADAGTLFDTDATVAVGSPLDRVDIRSSVGGSILWASPLGPLRADFAQVITRDGYDRTQFFRFGGATQF